MEVTHDIFHKLLPSFPTLRTFQSNITKFKDQLYRQNESLSLADRKSDFTLLVFDKSEFLAELMNENDSF